MSHVSVKVMGASSNFLVSVKANVKTIDSHIIPLIPVKVMSVSRSWVHADSCQSHRSKCYSYDTSESHVRVKVKVMGTSSNFLIPNGSHVKAIDSSIIPLVLVKAMLV